MKANQYIREVEVKFKSKPAKEKQVKVTSAKEAVQLFKDLENETQEKIIALHLDVRNTVICFQIVFIGTSTLAITDPKAILRTSLLTNSTALIVIHNHPSGNPQPSQDDIKTEGQLQEACKCLNIQLLDFIIIGDNSAYYSFADQGRLNKVL